MNQQDQIYIDSVQEQINKGMYDHLFKDAEFDYVFLDIGANIGLVSMYARPFCKIVIAVEPDPVTFQSLLDTTKYSNMIECVQAALTPVDGPHEFFVNDINFTASSTVNTYGQRIMVEGKTLATILKENNLDHVDVAKVDIEGGEGRSLNYEQLSYASPIIDTFFIEMHNCPETDWQHKLGTIVSYLARLGYENQQIRGMALTATKIK